MTVTPNLALGHAAATGRLLAANGSVRRAFDELGTGVMFDDLIAYIERDFHAAALRGVVDDPDRFHGRLVGLIAGAALTIVEADRLKRAGDIAEYAREQHARAERAEKTLDEARRRGEVGP